MTLKKLKQASKSLRLGNLEKAKNIYTQIKEDTDISRTAYVSSLSFMLNKLTNEKKPEKPDFVAASNDHKIKRSNVILLINPSHAHQLEQEFWEDFGKEAHRHGFEIVELAFRSVTPYSTNITLINPARAVDLARKYANYENAVAPAWFNDDILEHYSDWEHRRWQIQKYQPAVKIGISNTAKFIDQLVRDMNPQLIVTSNKIDWPNNFGFRAAKHYGINYFFFERSPLDSHIVESNGMFTESILCKRLIHDCNLDMSKLDKVRASSLIAGLTSNPYGFRAEEAVKKSLPEIDSRKKIFFLPLDNIIWTGWGMNLAEQGKIDYPLYSSPLCALKQIIEEVVKLGGQLVIKPHPSCKEWPLLAADAPGAIFCDSDLQDLIKISDVVVTFLTKVAYVALAFNKPVISFGGGLLDNLGVTYQVNCTSMLKWQLESALSKVDLNLKLSRFRNILPALDDSFFEDGSSAFEFMKKDLSNIVSTELINIDVMLASIQRKKINNHERVPSNLGLNIESYKPTVIFDVSRLTAGALWNSGVSRYGRAVVSGLKRSRLFNVICGANFANNEFGLSSYWINKIQYELDITIVDINDAFDYMENNGVKYIYHSPINPEKLKEIHNNAKKIITVHDILHVTQSEFYESSNTITPKIIDSINHKDTGVIFVSEYSKNDFEKYTGKEVNNCKVTHLGVDECFITGGHTKSVELIRLFDKDLLNLVIPFQGDPRKGFVRMLKIGKKWQENSDFSKKIIVFGSSKNKSRFVDVCNKIGLFAEDDSKVVYISDCSDSELAFIYKNSNAHLYLSNAEGFGLPPLEAMSCGCPSITLNNTSLSEVYNDWPLLLDNDVNDDVIIHILEKLGSDLNYSNEMKYKAIKFSNLYNWRETVEKTMMLYFDLLKISNQSLNYCITDTRLPVKTSNEL